MPPRSNPILHPRRVQDVAYVGQRDQRVLVRSGFARNFLAREHAAGVVVQSPAARRTNKLRLAQAQRLTGEDKRIEEANAAARALQEQRRAEEARSRRVDKVLKALRLATVRFDRHLEDTDPAKAQARRARQEAMRAERQNKREMWRAMKDKAYEKRRKAEEAGSDGGEDAPASAAPEAGAAPAGAQEEAGKDDALLAEGVKSVDAAASEADAAGGEDGQVVALEADDAEELTAAELEQMEKDEEDEAASDAHGRITQPVTKEDLAAYCLDRLGIHMPLDCLDMPTPLGRAGEHGVRVMVPGRPDSTMLVKIVGHVAYTKENLAARSKLKSFKSSAKDKSAGKAGAKDAAAEQFYE